MHRTKRFVALTVVLASGAACQALLDDAKVAGAGVDGGDDAAITADASPGRDGALADVDVMGDAVVLVDAGENCVTVELSIANVDAVDGGAVFAIDAGRYTAQAPARVGDAESYARVTTDLNDRRAWSGFRVLRLKSTVTFNTVIADTTHVLELRFRAAQPDGSVSTVSAFVVKTSSRAYTLGAKPYSGEGWDTAKGNLSLIDGSVPLVLEVRPLGDAGEAKATLTAAGSVIEIDGGYLKRFAELDDGGTSAVVRVEVGIPWVNGPVAQGVTHEAVSFEICR